LEGVEYPLIKIHISSSSHPFFTGEERIVDVEGRVDKFKARQAAAVKAREARAAAKPKAKKQREAEATKLGQSKAEKPGKTTSEAKPAEQAQE
jgi:large subunit ribosomal protein L31